MQYSNNATLVALIAVGSVVNTVAMTAATADDLQVMVEADWTAQERRLGRTPDSPEAIRDVLKRAERLRDDLRQMRNPPDLRAEVDALARLQQKVTRVKSLDVPTRLALYHEVRSAARNMALKNPLLTSRQVVFLKRRRFVFQMLHEFVGYYYNYVGTAGGCVCVLEDPGRSLAVRDLTGDCLPRGNYATLALSFDARTAYFAFAEVADRSDARQVGDWTLLKPAASVPAELNYYSPERCTFHIFAMDTDGGNLRQLTHGPDDDFDPCPLPNGEIAFLSTRRGGFCRCGGDYEPVPTYTLHRMDASGDSLRTLSLHETNEWNPSVLADGRIVYSRWDYVDRSAAHFHGLWVSNPDGSNPQVLFGNYTKQISACFQPRAIPGSNQIVFVAGAHHSPIGGSLVVLNPARVQLDPDTGEDRFDCLEMLTPEVCFPEAPGWPNSFFHSPWPLSENYFLVSFSFDPLPGWGPRVKRDGELGLYYFDRFGNLELLYREKGISCVGAIPLASRAAPPAIPSAPDAELGDEGEFFLSDVNWSLIELPDARPVRQLRVFQLLPKTTHTADQPPIGYARQASARMLLGTVPVESDGSAYFRAPARKPLYFQAVDEAGRAVQTMRSITYLQPGERRGCVGCHERPGTPPPSRETLASRRLPSKIQPGPDGTRPFSYPRLVQPVLDRNCLGCHDGTDRPGKSPLILSGEPAGTYTRSYNSLMPHVRWHSWLGEGIQTTATRPGETGTDQSPLTRILDDADHSGKMKLSAADRQRLHIWLDGNSPFYGTYDKAEQRAQLAGEAIPLPGLQ